MSIVDYASVDEIVRALDLSPHPEGGFYRETFRDPLRRGGRAVSTAIYYLLPAGRISAWHRVDAAEIWHYYAGAPLMLRIIEGAAQQMLAQMLDLLENVQSAGNAQPSPAAHLVVHVPPQSTPVSWPSFSPFSHGVVRAW